MDAISPTAPAETRGSVPLRVAAAGLAVTALGMLAGGYALGRSDGPATTTRAFVGSHPTLDDAARESASLKYRAAERAAGTRDIRLERVR
jgi:hypothetical protein